MSLDRVGMPSRQSAGCRPSPFQEPVRDEPDGYAARHICPAPAPASPGSTTCSAAAWPATGCTCSRAARAPARPRSRCSSCWPAPQAGEAGIYVSLAETEQELRDGARSHGWTIDDKIEIFELVPPESVLDPDQHQSLLYSSDLELGETIKRIFEAIERVKPQARRDRQPVGDPPAGAELAALPPPDPGAEALFRAAQLDRDAARRPHHRNDRPRGAQHRAQRDPSRPAGADLWRRAAPAARRQVPRPERSAAAITTS